MPLEARESRVGFVSMLPRSMTTCSVAQQTGSESVLTAFPGSRGEALSFVRGIRATAQKGTSAEDLSHLYNRTNFSCGNFIFRAYVRTYARNIKFEKTKTEEKQNRKKLLPRHFLTLQMPQGKIGMTHQPPYDENAMSKKLEKIRIEASSKSINLTLKDIGDILAGKDISLLLRDRPLRDTLTIGLYLLRDGLIYVPRGEAPCVITPTTLEPYFDDQGFIDPRQLDRHELSDFLEYITTLQMAEIEMFPTDECMLYVKYIEGIFKERLERQEADDLSIESNSATLYTQSDIENAKNIYEEMLSKLPNKKLEIFDIADSSI